MPIFLWARWFTGWVVLGNGRLNDYLLGEQSNLLGGQTPTQFYCYIPPCPTGSFKAFSVLIASYTWHCNRRKLLPVANGLTPDSVDTTFISNVQQRQRVISHSYVRTCQTVRDSKTSQAQSFVPQLDMNVYGVIDTSFCVIFLIHYVNYHDGLNICFIFQPQRGKLYCLYFILGKQTYSNNYKSTFHTCKSNIHVIQQIY